MNDPLVSERRLFGRFEWLLLGAVVLLAGVIAPLAHALLPDGAAWRPSSYVVTLVGKFACYAMLAVAMDLIWGYAGILSLGQSLWFALGGYVFGMHLMRGIGREGQYQSDLPDFMVFLDWKTLPWHWWNSDSFVWSLLLVILVPGVLAFVFGWFAFRSRIRGVYFSIITQALTYAAMLLFFRNETGFGGNNGFTDFKTLLGFRITDPAVRATLLAITVGSLAAVFVFSRWLVQTRFGRVLQAIRDAEGRVRFCGYDTLRYKLGIWTVAAVISGVAGALYVPQVGIINPGEMSPANGIEIAVWTAVGGRGTLIGPILGAWLVNGAKSWFTMAFPEYWLFFLGALFVGVTLYLPSGVIGFLRSIPGFGALGARGLLGASTSTGDDVHGAPGSERSGRPVAVPRSGSAGPGSRS